MCLGSGSAPAHVSISPELPPSPGKPPSSQFESMEVARALLQAPWGAPAQSIFPYQDPFRYFYLANWVLEIVLDSWVLTWTHPLLSLSRNTSVSRAMDDSCELDLVYVTERIIAVSFPSTANEENFRSNLHEVAQMLRSKHGGNYLVGRPHPSSCSLPVRRESLPTPRASALAFLTLSILQGPGPHSVSERADSQESMCS